MRTSGKSSGWNVGKKTVLVMMQFLNSCLPLKIEIGLKIYPLKNECLKNWRKDKDLNTAVEKFEKIKVTQNVLCSYSMHASWSPAFKIARRF